MPSSRCWEGAPAAAQQLQTDSLDLDHGHAHQLAGSAAGCDPHRIMHTQKPTPQTSTVAEGQARAVVTYLEKTDESSRTSLAVQEGNCLERQGMKAVKYNVSTERGIERSALNAGQYEWCWYRIDDDLMG